MDVLQTIQRCISEKASYVNQTADSRSSYSGTGRQSTQVYIAPALLPALPRAAYNLDWFHTRATVQPVSVEAEDSQRQEVDRAELNQLARMMPDPAEDELFDDGMVHHALRHNTVPACTFACASELLDHAVFDDVLLLHLPAARYIH